MTTRTTHGQTNPGEPVLYMALELSNTKWKVLFADAGGMRREVDVPARDTAALLAAIATAKTRLRLPPGARVISCYEAGRDGFWLHQMLTANGVENLVVDSASIEVAQRSRRSKTDRLDVHKLLRLLLRHCGGECGVWSVLRIPDAAAEDIRQSSRTIDRLKTERKRHVARLKSLLALHGLAPDNLSQRNWAERVAGFRRWDGSALPKYAQVDLILEGERLALAERQLRDLKAERARFVATSPSPQAAKARQLAELGGIAEESSFVFATELFGWRKFANRRELAGSVGITGTPFASGASTREQGISKAGNGRMRTMLVEIAWCWLRYQPTSALSLWWEARFGAAGGRQRRTGIVALARKLLVALWRYLEEGLVPEGAVLKTKVRPASPPLAATVAA